MGTLHLWYEAHDDPEVIKMKFGTTFYLSRVIGNTVYTAENKPIGKLRDIVVDLNYVRPRVTAAKVKLRDKTCILDFASFSIAKLNAQYRIQCDQLQETNLNAHSLLLVKDVLDKQIVDMYGRKVVRVNDLRLVVLSNGTYLVAVDVGFEGFLRRLGVAKPMKRLLRPLKINISSNLLLWDEVETIDISRRGLKLSKTYTKLSTMHPSDLADILEDLDRTTQIEIFTSLDEDKAADVLEELETDAQVRVVESLTVDEAAQMLERLPPDEAADILDELEDGKVDEILMAMNTEARSEIRDLMDYPDDSVGSLMTTEFVSVSTEMSVHEALDVIRELKPDADNVHDIFVVDDNLRLQGVVSLRDLIIASPESSLRDIMNREPIFVFDDDEIDELVARMSKYNLFSIPVLDKTRELIGMVRLNDVLETMVKSRKKRH
jgi:magnesium transporter